MDALAHKVPKRIAVDFDGTIADTDFPVINGLKPGAKEALTLFRDLGYYIVIWSCRTCHWDYAVYGGDPGEPPLERERVKDMIAFLDANGIPYDEVDDGTKGKPGAEMYIDDKGVRFEDNWKHIAEVVLLQSRNPGFTYGQIEDAEVRILPKENVIVRDGCAYLLGRGNRVNG